MPTEFQKRAARNRATVRNAAKANQEHRRREALLDRADWEPHTPEPPIGPDCSGLLFLPVTGAQLDLILEALGTAAGDAVDRDGPADWEPFATLQTHLAGFHPRGPRGWPTP